MAGKAIPLNLSGMEFLVETIAVPGSEETSALERAESAVTESFKRAQAAIVAMAQSAQETLTEFSKRSTAPDEFSITFGVKFTAQGNVIIAGVSGEATLEVTIKYAKPPGGSSTAK